MKNVELTNNSKKIGKILRIGIDTNCRRAAESWLRGINQVMAETARSGRRYYYRGLGWTRASLPGRPPAIQTGEYARSLQVRRIANGPAFAVGTKDIVGWFLEKGTENMAPRPHFMEGYHRHQSAIKKAMGQEVTRRESRRTAA